MRLAYKIFRHFVFLLDLISIKSVLVLGDSHVHVFKHPKVKYYFPHIKFKVISVGGATASGLENPNSKTQAYTIFQKSLKKYDKYNTVILMLGEVDTGFVIWYRAEKYKVSVEDMLNDTIRKYTKFIFKVSETRNLIVISTPLPTITDDNDWGEIANLRKEVKANQKERTNLTLKFNKLIEEFCNAKGIMYINLDDRSISENGMVKKELLNKDKSNHHYDEKKYIDLISTDLKKVLKQR